MMSALRNGMVNNTPSTPPVSAIDIVVRKSNPCQYCSISNAGNVKITPAARDSPADAAVCTILFSRIFDVRKKRRIAMDMTAAGMEADTVRPTLSPR